MIPMYKFGSEQLAAIHNARVPEWDGVSYEMDGSRRLTYVYPAGMHLIYIVDHGDFTVKACARGGLSVPIEIEMKLKQVTT